MKLETREIKDKQKEVERFAEVKEEICSDCKEAMVYNIMGE